MRAGLASVRERSLEIQMPAARVRGSNACDSDRCDSHTVYRKVAWRLLISGCANCSLRHGPIGLLDTSHNKTRRKASRCVSTVSVKSGESSR